MNNLGNKEALAKNLQHYMNIYDKTRNDIARDLDIPYTTITNWLNAEKYPRIDKIEMMSNYFGIDKSDLIEANQFGIRKVNGIKIPVLGRVQAGIPIEAIEEVIDYEEISEDVARCGDFFGLQVKGNSMEPKFSEGDVVIVRKQPDIESGQIGIIIVNGTDATVKRVVKHDEGGISLISLNPSYAPKYFTNNEIINMPVSIIGRVVELRAKF